MGISEDWDKDEQKLKEMFNSKNRKRMDTLKGMVLEDLVSESGIDCILVRPGSKKGTCYVKFEGGEEFGFECFDVTQIKEDK